MSVIKAILNGIRAIVYCGRKASREAAPTTTNNFPVAAKKDAEDTGKNTQGFTKTIKAIVKRKSMARIQIGNRTIYKLVVPAGLPDENGATEYQDIWISYGLPFRILPNMKRVDFEPGRHISPIAPVHPLEISLDPALQPPKSYQCFVRTDGAILFFDLDKPYPLSFIELTTQPTEDCGTLELRKNRIGVSGKKFSQSRFTACH